eukprot:13662662-Alexandrium_andersonii.AAC.1
MTTLVLCSGPGMFTDDPISPCPSLPLVTGFRNVCVCAATVCSVLVPRVRAPLCWHMRPSALSSPGP